MKMTSMKMPTLKATAAALIAAAGLSCTQLAMARDYISIVGSSTVYPFSTVVAERLGKTAGISTPTVESTGTGGGMKLFCNGVGPATADITNASRRMKASEFEQCQSNGVTEIIEVLVGYDGIVVANSQQQDVMDISRREIFLALAKEVPDPNGSSTLVANPYKTWNEINPELPAKKIEVLGPPPTSGTRDAFVELAMEGGCESFPFFAALKKTDEDRFKALCHTIREDGAYIETGENDNLIVQKLEKNPNSFGIFGFSFLDQNSDKVHGSLIEGHEPTFESIADKSYSVSRPLYFYAKKAHIGVVPGIQEYINEFTSEKAWGDDGYLAEKGMIPLAEAARADIGAKARGLQVMSGEDL